MTFVVACYCRGRGASFILSRYSVYVGLLLTVNTMASLNDNSFSSEDPLAGSLNRPSSPLKGAKLRNTSPTKIVPNNRSKERRTLQDVIVTTPPAKKSRNPSLSPWRIRVTVEAENDEDEVKRKPPAAARSPRKRSSPQKKLSDQSRVESRTTTTTIPLNDGDGAMTEPKRGRGRPRKSPAPGASTRGTPAPTKWRGKSQKAESNDDMGVEAANTLPSKAPKRKRTNDGEHEHACQDEEVDLLSDCNHSPSSKNGDSGVRASRRRKTSPDFDIAMDSDVSLKQTQQKNAAAKKPGASSAVAKSKESSGASQSSNDDFSYRRTGAKPTKASSTKPTKPTTNSQPADPTNVHSEFDSIMESEGFSVVSLSSVPSAQQYSGSSGNSDSLDSAGAQLLAENGQDVTSHPREKADHTETAKSVAIPKPSKASTMTKHPLYCSGSPASRLPVSGDLKAKGSQHTAKISTASSSLPKAVASGLVGEVNSILESRKHAGPDHKHQTGDLFNGFRDGTRRELRAGLRLGEELSKRGRGVNSDNEGQKKADVNTKVGSQGVTTPPATESDEEMEDQADAALDDSGMLADETDIWQLEAISKPQASKPPQPAHEAGGSLPSKATRNKIPTSWNKDGREDDDSSGHSDTPSSGSSDGGARKRSLALPVIESLKSQKLNANTSPHDSQNGSVEAEEDNEAEEEDEVEDLVEAESDEEAITEEEEEDEEEVLEGEDEVASSEGPEDDGDSGVELEGQSDSSSAAKVGDHTQSVVERVRSRFLGDVYRERTAASSKSASPKPTRASVTSASLPPRRLHRPARRVVRTPPPSPPPPQLPRDPPTAFLRSIAYSTFKFMCTPLPVWRWMGINPPFGRLPDQKPPPRRIPEHEEIRFIGHAPYEAPGPFYRHFPPNVTHWYRLDVIYRHALNNPDEHPFHPTGPAAVMRGYRWHVCNWEKELTDLELAVCDEFMAVLERDGAEDDRGAWARYWARPLLVSHAGRMLIGLWIGQAIRGEQPLRADEVLGDWDHDYLFKREEVMRQHAAAKVAAEA